MRKTTFLLVMAILPASCSEDLPPGIDLREEMREFVIGISEYARASDASFVVVPQNGIELVSANGEPDGPAHKAYLDAINGHGQEDLFYGYDRDDKATPDGDNAYLRSFLDLSLAEGNTILVTDYCSTHSHMDDSYARNHAAGYVSFAADSRELDRIPVYPDPIFGENADVISSLQEVRNFLYLIDPENFSSKLDFIQAVTSTNYDLLIMDLFFHDNSAFTVQEINQLKSKANGGKRLVISYMSIGEAEDYRYYWQSGWSKDPPSWLDRENPSWKGNFKVRYWEEAWQAVIYGNQDSYLEKIINAGFNGVYLDIIDAFEYYE
jgi:cysteinyl-tRNA synthetase